MYVVIGGTGFLGSYIVREIQKQTAEKIIVASRKQIQPFLSVEENHDGNILHISEIEHRLYGRVRDGGGWIKCDILNHSDLDKLIQIINSIEEPCKIIYLSAYLHPDLVEENPWISWNMNVISLEYLLSRLKKCESFVFASTDSVYGESLNHYHFKEADRLNPVNLYGVQKTAGEAIVYHYGYHSVRYPLLIGPSITEGRPHFYDTIVDNLKQGIKTEMFFDSIRSTLDFETAAALTIRLLENHKSRMPPILNVSGDEELSKFDLGIRIAKRLALPEDLIIPVSVYDEQKIYRAKRAACTLMDNSVLKHILSQEYIRAKL